MSMKRIAVVTVAAALALAGCGSGGATEGGGSSLTWYSVIPAQPAQAVLDAFHQDHPDIAVTLTQLQPGPLVETFLADAGRRQVKADVVTFSTVADMRAAQDAGAVAEYVPSGVERMRKEVRIAEPYGVALYLNPYTWAYRTDLPAEVLNRFRAGDWSMFADPAVADVLRGRVASGDPTLAGAPYSAHVALDDAWGDARYFDWLKNTFRPLQPVLYDSNVPAADSLASGEAVAALISQNFAIQQIAKGAPIETSLFDPTPAYPTMTSVATDAPHEQAAYTFMDWLVSDAGQAALEASYDTASGLEGWVDKRAQTTKSWYDPSAPGQDPSRIHVAPLDKALGTDRKAFLSQWQQAMGR
jgi:iron(III) transport system substrate-binding protein